MGTNDPEAHHAAPRCLISLHEKANGTSLDGEGIQAWLEWEWEAMRWCVGEAPPDPRERLAQVGFQGRQGDLEALRPAVVLATRPQEVGSDRP
jgi:hypothetical protein